MQLTHLEHIEDNILEHPDKVLEAMGLLTEGSAKLSLKWDGAPSIVFGKHPENGKFFVGTKSVFNASPKVNYTCKDVMNNHGDNSNLASKMMYVLEVLRETFNHHGVFQADLLFCRNDVFEDESKGLCFTPNTLTYVTYVKSTKDLISNAYIGLAVHTEYMRMAGSLKLQDMQAAPISSVLNLPSNVYQAPIAWNARSTHNCWVSNTRNYLRNVDQKFIDDRIVGTGLWGLYKIFQNSLIKEGVTYDSSMYDEKSHQRFVNWVIDRYSNQMKKRKTHAGMKTKMYELDDMLAIATDKKVVSIFKNLAKARHEVTQLKNEVLKSTRNGHSFSVMWEGNPTNHEGLVLQLEDGSLMKLVDRYTFSRMNFAKNGDSYKK